MYFRFDARQPAAPVCRSVMKVNEALDERGCFSRSLTALPCDSFSLSRKLVTHLPNLWIKKEKERSLSFSLDLKLKLKLKSEKRTTRDSIR